MLNEKLFENAREVDIFADLSAEDKVESRIIADIAIAVRNKRDNMGLTQEAFAEYVGVPQAVVSKCESGDCDFTLKSLIVVLEKIGLSLKVAS
jgi:predicted XRE-type DNA-binding protein